MLFELVKSVDILIRKIALIGNSFPPQWINNKMYSFAARERETIIEQSGGDRSRRTVYLGQAINSKSE